MAESNTNSRLEAFCDGVFAIALTLLIIDIKIPSRENIYTTNDLWLSLTHLLPSIFAFLLSFIIVFITWVNHHLTKNEKSTLAMGKNQRNGYFAFIFYALCAIIAFWFPLTIAILISLTWLVWLIISINIKGD